MAYNRRIDFTARRPSTLTLDEDGEPQMCPQCAATAEGLSAIMQRVQNLEMAVAIMTGGDAQEGESDDAAAEPSAEQEGAGEVVGAVREGAQRVGELSGKTDAERAPGAPQHVQDRRIVRTGDVARGRRSDLSGLPVSDVSYSRSCGVGDFNRHLQAVTTPALVSINERNRAAYATANGAFRKTD